MLRIVNLEEGYPRVEEAIRKLDRELYKASTEGVRVMRIIHGYGSSGNGGRIKEAVNRYLLKQVRRNGITDFINGENWTIFCERTRAFLDTFDCLKKDEFLNRSNYGITYVML